MIAQTVSAPALTFQGDLARGFVLGVKAVAPEKYSYTLLYPFVHKIWPKQRTAGQELETAFAYLGSAVTLSKPLRSGEDMALGFVLGVLAASRNKIVPLPKIVEHAQACVDFADYAAVLAEASRKLIGLVSIESMSGPVAQWRLWLRFRSETV